MKNASEVHTIAVSRFIRDQMIRAGCPSEKLHALPSPAPDIAAPYVPTPVGGTPRFLFLGRLVPEKGPEWLLRAFARVPCDIRLDMAGEGYIQEDLRRLATDLGIADRVTFHPWLPPTQLTSLLQSARAVVMPSLWHEPAGLVTLEAAAAGRAVITSRVGGIPEYALEAYATLVSPNDVSGLASAIASLAESWETSERMGRQGQELARSRFSMRQFLIDLDHLYDLARADAPWPSSIASPFK